MSQNDYALVAIALLNMLTAFFAWRTHASQSNNASAITKLEQNTNSIKDALVAATGKAAFAAGETKAREAGEVKAAALEGNVTMGILENIIAAIYRFIGGHKSLEELGVALDASAAVAPEKLDWRNSIVDLMKLTNQDSSLAAREALAKELGYQGPFDGSAAMNVWLHQKVMDRLR